MLSSKFKISFIFVIVFQLIACTSLGHEGRTEPQIEKRLLFTPLVVAIGGSGELNIAIEKLLVSRGVKVVASSVQIKDGIPQTVAEYVVNVNSVDHDLCVPEGSRQMHFYISVVDLNKNDRIFGMSGDYGCKDTLVKRFENWFFING